jgi:uncharacterized protein (UPF0254 family)
MQTHNLGVRQRMAELLRRVAEGATNARDAIGMIKQWSDVGQGDRLVNAAYEGLLHFDADADIMEKDERYAARQIEGLRRMVSKLEESTQK